MKFLDFISICSSLIGSYFLSKSMFQEVVARKLWLRQTEKFSLPYIIVGWLFGINKNNWLKFFSNDLDLSKSEKKKFRNPFWLFYGFTLLTIAGILQLIILFCF